MVYSNFMFVCLRAVFAIFYVRDALTDSITSAYFAYNYALDSFCAMSIYVFPKIFRAIKNSESYRAGVIASRKSKLSSEAESQSVRESFELQMLVCTANFGNAEPSFESMRNWIPTNGDCALLAPLEGVESKTNGRFGIIAIGMQEATWKEMVKKDAALKSNELSEEEVLNALDEQNTVRIREILHEVLGDGYCQLVDEQRGQMRFPIWVSDEVVDRISDVRVTGANTGIGNVLANKGGIVTSFTYMKTRISFLSAHLAAHEGEMYYKMRCDSIRSILKEATNSVISKKIDVATSSHHVFIIGDLNFRTKFSDDTPLEENVKRAASMIAAGDFAGLYGFDELANGLSKGDLLVDFKTLPCNFPPTFKVRRETGFIFSEQRTPSYTDRILFKSAVGLTSNLKPLAYEPCAEFITSDHKPIRGAFSVIPNETMDVFEVAGEYELVFENMKAFNVKAESRMGCQIPI
jgi:hypothetical protein